MSQSDYIKFKKTGIQLQNRLNNPLPHILTASQYTTFIDYNTETKVLNTAINYGKQTIPNNVIQVFDMKIGNAVSCPSYGCPIPVVVDDVPSGGDGGTGGDGGV